MRRTQVVPFRSKEGRGLGCVSSSGKGCASPSTPLSLLTLQGEGAITDVHSHHILFPSARPVPSNCKSGIHRAVSQWTGWGLSWGPSRKWQIGTVSDEL